LILTNEIQEKRTENKMKTFSYKGFKVTVFEHYNGQTMYINNPQGVQIWAHKFIGAAFEQAKRVINGK